MNPNKYSGTSGLYIRADLLNGLTVLNYFREFRRLITMYRAQEMHTTIMYSRKVAPSTQQVNELLSNQPQEKHATIDHVEYWAGHDNLGYLVLILKSDDLVERNRIWSKTQLIHSKTIRRTQR